MFQRFLNVQCVLLFVCAAWPASAAEHWIRVATSHFEMYTPNSEKQAVRALQTFENVRSFFLQASNNRNAPEDLVRIIAFSSEQQYKPYRMNAGNFAFYQRSHERDYIVMQDIQAEHSQAAVHEYTHLIIRHMKLELPAWLDEGMADLYSSLEPKGQKAMIGRPLAGHMQELLTQRWIDWNVLFAVDHNSPYYNDPRLMPMFYAQSWALAHMLNLDAGYRHGFSRFLGLVASGTPAVNAFRDVYGKTLQDVASDVQRYVHAPTFNAVVIDISLSKRELDPDVSPVSDFQRDFVLADVLAMKPATVDEGRKKLLALEQQNPNNYELEEALGYVAWEQNNIPEACKHFGAAVDRGSRNTTMVFHYAQLLQSRPGSSSTIVQLLQRVLAKQPDNMDARLFLAAIEANGNHYAAVLEALAPVHNVKPEQACQLFTLIAFARANLKDYAGAKDFANKALPYAKTVNERAQIDNILRFVEVASNRRAAMAEVPQDSRSSFTAAISESTVETVPPARPKRDPSILELHGTTKAFECSQAGFRLRVEAAGRDRVFDLPHDPKDILIQTAGRSVTLEWACGPMKPQDVTVLYRTTGGSKTEGTITELDF